MRDAQTLMREGEGVQGVFEAACVIKPFTCQRSSPQFCTRNRESVPEGQRGKGSLAKLERHGRMEARNWQTGQRIILTREVTAV